MPPTSKYVWQHNSWPNFQYSAEQLLAPLAHCRRLQGELLQQLASLDDKYAIEAEAHVLEAEAIRTSEIEGIQLNPQSVRSSVARKLGLEDAGLHRGNRYEEGLIEILLDATQHHEDSLSADRLFGWHAALFPTGYSGMSKIAVGSWRTDEHGAMLVASGRPHKQTIHYEAPPAGRLANEMEVFIRWFNAPSKHDGIIRAAVAHFWFVTLHPFDDGNGRLARIITDMAMAQDEKTSRRAYSLSAQIASTRRSYYQVLEQVQKGDGDITAWLLWFIEALELAMRNSQVIVGQTLKKASFWRIHAQTSLNDRQRKVINKLLDAGPEGFEGGLTNKKYVGMTKAASATATRDLVDLAEKGLLVKIAGGRSTRYELAWPDL